MVLSKAVFAWCHRTWLVCCVAKEGGGSCAANVGADVSQKEEMGVRLAVCKSACAYRSGWQLGGLFR